MFLVDAFEQLFHDCYPPFCLNLICMNSDYTNAVYCVPYLWWWSASIFTLSNARNQILINIYKHTCILILVYTIQIYLYVLRSRNFCEFSPKFILQTMLKIRVRNIYGGGIFEHIFRLQSIESMLKNHSSTCSIFLLFLALCKIHIYIVFTVTQKLIPQRIWSLHKKHFSGFLSFCFLPSRLYYLWISLLLSTITVIFYLWIFRLLVYCYFYFIFSPVCKKIPKEKHLEKNANFQKEKKRFYIYIYS